VLTCQVRHAGLLVQFPSAPHVPHVLHVPLRPT